ncbi:MAG: PqqD family protein [Myxococcales bacterium]|jgi:hypothetical protein
MTFEPTWRPRRSVDVAWNEVAGEIVVVSASRGTVCGLSEGAGEIWRMCDGQTTVSQMAQRLYEQFDVEKQVVEDDLARFLQDLVEQALLEPPELRE